jgi:hypothetical protein
MSSSITEHLEQATRRLVMKREKAFDTATLRGQLIKNVVYFSLQTRVYFDVLCSIATGTISTVDEVDSNVRFYLSEIHESGDVERIAAKLTSGGLTSRFGVPGHLRQITGWSIEAIETCYVLGCAANTFLGVFSRLAVDHGPLPENIPALQANLLLTMAEHIQLRDVDVLKVLGNYHEQSNLF